MVHGRSRPGRLPRLWRRPATAPQCSACPTRGRQREVQIMTDRTENVLDKARTAPVRRRGVVRYHGAHARLYRERGPASVHRCAVCGDQAAEWSYDGTDPLEFAELPAPSPFPRRPRRYSMNPDMYAPLCRPCHRHRDRPTHCRYGHRLDGMNGHQQRPSRPTRRECRECRRDRDRRRRQHAATPQHSTAQETPDD